MRASWRITLDAALRHEPGEMLEGPVVAALRIRRKTAGREFPAVQVVAQTIAACAFPRTRFITAVAVLSILRLLAFHECGSFAWNF